MPRWERRRRRWRRKPYRRQYGQPHRAKRKALTPAVEAGLHTAPGVMSASSPARPGTSATWTVTVFAMRGLSTDIRAIARRARQQRNVPSPQAPRDVSQRGRAAQVARMVNQSPGACWHGDPASVPRARRGTSRTGGESGRSLAARPRAAHPVRRLVNCGLCLCEHGVRKRDTPLHQEHRDHGRLSFGRPTLRSSLASLEASLRASRRRRFL
jgi:type IV secretory pathway TrbL component